MMQGYYVINEHFDVRRELHKGTQFSFGLHRAIEPVPLERHQSSDIYWLPTRENYVSE